MALRPAARGAGRPRPQPQASPAAAPSDHVFVRGVEFEASHGFTAAERRGTRRFRCDVDLVCDLAASSRSDRLSDTIDYRRICQVIVDVGTSRTFKLIEALAGAIADDIHALYPRARVTLTLEKLAPPCAGAPAASGVRITRG